MLQVMVLTPQKILYEGRAKQMILPGEKGTFEILGFHKPIVSRLLTGELVIGRRRFGIQRGVVKAEENRVVCLVEPEGRDA